MMPPLFLFLLATLCTKRAFFQIAQDVKNSCLYMFRKKKISLFEIIWLLEKYALF